MKRIAAYFWLCLAMCASVAWAVDAPWAWFTRTWQSDAGLPDNTVVGVEQTPDGFLWVATKTGLARFDGLRFVPFPLMPESAPASTISAMCTDLRGRVWGAHESEGIVCVEPSGRTTVFTQKDGLPGEPARMMVLDAEGAVWVTYRDGEVVRIRDGQRGFPRGGKLAGSQTRLCEFPDGPVRRAETTTQSARTHRADAGIGQIRRAIPHPTARTAK